MKDTKEGSERRSLTDSKESAVSGSGANDVGIEAMQQGLDQELQNDLDKSSQRPPAPWQGVDPTSDLTEAMKESQVDHSLLEDVTPEEQEAFNELNRLRAKEVEKSYEDAREFEQRPRPPYVDSNSDSAE